MLGGCHGCAYLKRDCHRADLNLIFHVFNSRPNDVPQARPFHREELLDRTMERRCTFPCSQGR